MSNKNINDLSLLTDTATGDYLVLWDTSAGLTYKVYVNDIINLEGTDDEWFNNIYVRRYARMSGIIGGNTGTNLISGLHPGILAGANNRAVRNQSAVLNGDANLASGISSLVAGEDNQVFGALGVALGGQIHFVEPEGASVLGGFSNAIYGVDANDSSIIGGNLNIIRGDSDNSVVLGGASNALNAQNASILAGTSNKASGLYSIVLGGANNVSSGEYTITVGRKSEAFPNGATMFGDSTDVVKRAYGPNSITINYSGGAWITGGGLNARRGFNLYPTGDAPTSSTAGRSGDFAYKDDYIYVFTGDNADLSNRNWGRIQLSTLNNTPPSIVSNDSSIVHGGSDPFEVTSVNSMENVVFGAGSPIISIPAGNNTFMIDCVFGICKGSTAAVATYTLWNDTDSRVIPNTSGRLTLLGTLTNPPVQQVHIRTITGTNYGAAKDIRLKVFKSEADAGGGNVIIGSTGTWISYVKLR